MRAEDFEAFHEGIIGAMSFYSRDVSRFALDVWWNALKGYDLPVIVEAFNRWVVNPDAGQFAPKPADIVKMLAGTSQDRALRAWAKVDQAVRRVGNYESVVFDDPVIHRVLHDMGGWVAMGQKTEDEWPFVAREFENRYRGFSSRNELPDYPKVMIGIAQSWNEQKGLASGAPMLIGNHEAAMRVMQSGTDAALISMRPASDAAHGAVLRVVKRMDDAA